MTTYQSIFTGEQIDAGVALAATALQPGEGGVQTYETVNELPMTGVTGGTLALVRTTLLSDSALFMWVGNETAGGWYRFATVNLAPTITSGPLPSYTVPTDGTPIELSLVAFDPEGLPIEWSYAVTSGSNTGLATITQGEGGTFTIALDPEASVGGSFSVTFSVTDGVSLAGVTSVFTVSFNVPSRFFMIGRGASPYVSLVDVEDNLTSSTPTGVPNSTLVGAGWVSRDLLIACTSSSTNNPVFYGQTTPGVFSRVHAGVSVGSASSGVSGRAAGSPDGRWAAITHQGLAGVALYELVDGVPTARSLTASNAVSVAFSLNSRFLAISTTTPDIRVYDLQSGSPVLVTTFSSGIINGPRWLSFTENHLFFVDATATPGLRTRVCDFNAGTGALSNTRGVPTTQTGTPTFLQVTSDGTTLLSVFATAIEFIDITAGPDTPVAFSPTGSALPATAIVTASLSGEKGRLAVGLSASPWLRIYEFDPVGRVLTEQTVTSPAAVATVVGVWSPGE